MASGIFAAFVAVESHFSPGEGGQFRFARGVAAISQTSSASFKRLVRASTMASVMSRQRIARG